MRGQEELGFNYRLTDIQSALGRSQLGRLEAFVARRNAIAGRYREALADVEALELPPGAPGGSARTRTTCSSSATATAPPRGAPCTSG